MRGQESTAPRDVGSTKLLEARVWLAYDGQEVKQNRDFRFSQMQRKSPKVAEAASQRRKKIHLPSKTTVSAPESDTAQKVVVRYADGRVLRGFLPEKYQTTLQGALPNSLVVKNSRGKLVEVGTSEIKAIFFVKSFEGNRDYSEFKVFGNRPNGKGVWVRVHFKDGEVIEGVAPNCIDTYYKTVFCMTPPDPGSNNQSVLVSKHFLKEMQVMGLASD